VQNGRLGSTIRNLMTKTAFWMAKNGLLEGQKRPSGRPKTGVRAKKTCHPHFFSRLITTYPQFLSAAFMFSRAKYTKKDSLIIVYFWSRQKTKIDSLILLDQCD
jgi:hypothetical protein